MCNLIDLVSVTGEGVIHWFHGVSSLQLPCCSGRLVVPWVILAAGHPASQPEEFFPPVSALMYLSVLFFITVSVVQQDM